MVSRMSFEPARRLLRQAVLCRNHSPIRRRGSSLLLALFVLTLASHAPPARAAQALPDTWLLSPPPHHASIRLSDAVARRLDDRAIDPSGRTTRSADSALTTAPVFAWHTFYGSAGWDGGAAVAVDASGNVYLAGTSESTWGSPLHAHTAGSNRDLTIVKLSSDGAYLWHTFYGSTGADQVFDIALDGDGNVYAAGQTLGSWAGLTPLHGYSSSLDTFVLKLNSAGVYQWHTFYGSTGQDAGVGLAVEGASLFVAGTSNVTWSGPAGQSPLHAFSGSGSSELFALKLDADGAFQWHTFYGSADYYEGGSQIAVDGEGNVLIAGAGTGSWNGPAGQAPLHAHSSAGLRTDMIVLKLASSGAFLWHAFYGSAGIDEAYGLALDTSGNVFVTGKTAGAWNGPAGQAPLHAYSGMNDILVLALDGGGAYQWHTFYGAAYYDDSPYAIALDMGNNLYVTGASAAWTGPAAETPLHTHSGSGTDLYVLHLDAGGAYQWHTFYGTTGDDYGYGVQVTPNADVHLAGQSSAEWGSPLAPYAGNSDMLVLKLESGIVVAPTTTSLSSSLNPSVMGQLVTLTATVAAESGTPSGIVSFRDGVSIIAGCSARPLNGSAQATCAVSALTAGSHTITASYSGGIGFEASTGTLSPNQTVNQATTLLTITGHTPDSSTVGQAVTVTYSVTVNAPGSGTPSGSVTVSDEVDSCTASVAAGSCVITLTTAGSRTLTASYAGDSNYSGSTSAGVAHAASQATTTTTITGHNPNPSLVGQAVTVNYTVTANPPGGGTPGGDVTVSDGENNCTGTVAAGSCVLGLAGAGSRSLTATYLGNSSYAGSTSVGVVHAVNTGSFVFLPFVRR